jgi:hypothetical protein
VSSAAEKKVVPVERPVVMAASQPFGLDVSVGRDGSVVILPTLPAPGERAVTLRMRGA